MDKKLIYIVNELGPSSSQHYAHIPTLLSRLQKDFGWTVFILQEKGAPPEDEALNGLEIDVMSSTSKVLRVLRLAKALLWLRVKGYRLVFVRISMPAAFISSLLARCVGMKVVFWQSGTVFEEGKGAIGTRQWWHYQQFMICVRLVDYFATGPETMVSYYEKKLGVPKRKLILLYNDIDPAWLGELGAQEKKETETISLAIIHRLTPVRRLKFYLPMILSTLNAYIEKTGVPVEMIIAGEGPECSAIKCIVETEAEGCIVKMLGVTPNRVVPGLIGWADIILVPSYQEGMPRVVLEAMLSGRPIVATDAGGISDLVGPEQKKYIASRESPGEFADKLALMLFDPDARTRVARENEAEAQRFTTKRVAEQYDQQLSWALICR